MSKNKYLFVCEIGGGFRHKNKYEFKYEDGNTYPDKFKNNNSICFKWNTNIWMEESAYIMYGSSNFYENSALCNIREVMQKNNLYCQYTIPDDIINNLMNNGY